ncbi:MAG: hypothetical protein WA231_04515 [Methylocella sp.]
MYRYLPVIVSLSIFFYAMVMRRLQRSVQPLRLEMADKGEWLLACNYLDAKVKVQISRILDGAFNYRLTSLFRIIIIPFLAAVIILWPKTLDNTASELNIKDERVMAYLNDVYRLHLRITFANHPILFAILIMELSIVIPLFDLSSAIMKGFTTIRRAWKAKEFLSLAWERPLNVIMAFADEKMYQLRSVRIA